MLSSYYKVCEKGQCQKLTCYVTSFCFLCRFFIRRYSMCQNGYGFHWRKSIQSLRSCVKRVLHKIKNNNCLYSSADKYLYITLIKTNVVTISRAYNATALKKSGIKLIHFKFELCLNPCLKFRHTIRVRFPGKISLSDNGKFAVNLLWYKRYSLVFIDFFK